MINGTNQEKAFYKAYRLCVGMADCASIQYYFDNKELAQVGTYEQQREVRDMEYWSHIEDCWLLWLEAIEYAKETTE
jgi:hypothetical protein